MCVCGCSLVPFKAAYTAADVVTDVGSSRCSSKGGEQLVW